MSGPNVSTDHLKYLERAFLDGAEPATLAGSAAYPTEGTVQLWRVESIPQHGDGEGPLERMNDVLTGLYGVGGGVGLAVVGRGSSVSVYLASWPAAAGDESAAGTSAEGHHGGSVPLPDLLAGAYPGIELEPAGMSTLESELASLSAGALVTGSPDASHDGTEQGSRHRGATPRVGLDRLVRSLGGDRWAYVACATPLPTSEVEKLSDQALNELRGVQNTVHRAEGETPIAAAYRDALVEVREKLAAGRTGGAWHTVGYLLAEDATIRDRARAVATGTFGGETSRPDPVRTVEVPDAQTVAASFGLPTVPGPDPPGTFRYPYRYPTVLSSGEVASVLHLPTREASGFHVRQQPQFDVTPHDDPDESAVTLGTVLDAGRPTGRSYAVDTASLRRHGLVVGTTGSGKTNTVFHVLRQLVDQGIPFLVVEPAKTEYRRLLDSEIGEDLQVFTLGDETTAPFRINPFEIRPGVPVQTHLDHLTALFNASFVMYAPMPYVLERCIHEVYEDRGWDLVESTNRRGRHPKAQPTITDLYEKVDPVVESLGYEREVTQDVSAALKTRIDNLRIGSKGLMLDTHTSVPIGDLLDRPTVLELDAVGDDAEKAFLMGLVLFSLSEHYQSTATEADGLRHVTVLEEAHRLLSADAGGGGPESSSKEGQAVESFTNLLAEIRAYGEGMVVVDQTPGKLAPSVVKNTNLKVVHRLLADDDRRLLGGSMGADADQTRWLGLSRVGEAAVFGGADDNPILVDVPYRKVEGEGDVPLAERIRDAAARRREAHPEQYASYPWVAADGTVVRRHRRAVAPVVDAPAFRNALARTVHAVLDGRSDPAAAAGELVDAVEEAVPAGRLEDLLVPALILGVEDRFETQGTAVAVPYEVVEALKTAFVDNLASALADDGRVETARLRGVGAEDERSFGERYDEVLADPTCPCVGHADAAREACRYHLDTARLVEAGRGEELTEALADSTDDLWERVATVAGEAAEEILPANAPPDERRLAALCFAVRATEDVETIDAELQAKLVDGLLATLELSGGDA